MTKQFFFFFEVADITGSSLSLAYTMIRQLNQELQEKGFYVVRGKISRAYFEERFYGIRVTE